MAYFAFFQAEAYAESLTFRELHGWKEDNHAAALEAFKRSCAASGDGMREICQSAALVEPSHARQFFEAHFEPRLVSDNAFYTGYYLPELKVSNVRTTVFKTPLFAYPDGFKGPWPTRQEIDEGKYPASFKPLGWWTDDKVGLFFLQVQGSGYLICPDGSRKLVTYAGRNGDHPYQSIGKVLIELGEIPKEEMSMPRLKEWLEKHPDLVNEVLWNNPSYIFFKMAKQEEALGGQGVPLTAERSLAVDTAHISYGTPVWIETQLPKETKEPDLTYNHLIIAQDTGSAIKGKGRADIFFGTGQQAELRAGYMKSPGRMIVLLPRG